MRDGWLETRLADIAFEVTDRVNPNDVADTRYVGLEHIDSGHHVLQRYGDSTDVVSHKTRFKAGDILFGKLRPYLRKSALATFDGMCSTDILVFRARPGMVMPEYLALILQTPGAFEHAERTSAGTRMPRTSARAMMGLRVLCPPLGEQRRIVDLISSIDQAVERGGRLEQQLDAVRGQLLADVLSPREGWQETTVGEIASITIGRTPPRNDSRYWTTSLERPFCTIADLTSHTVPTREGVTDLAEKEGKARRAPQGSLLFSFKLTIGRVGFAGVDLFPNEAIAIINPLADEIDKRYLGLALEMQDWATAGARAVKGNTLNRQSLEAIPIPLPPLSEQRRIVDLISSIDQALSRIDTVRAKAAQLRQAVLNDLTAGNHTIPDSYDHLLEDAS